MKLRKLSGRIEDFDISKVRRSIVMAFVSSDQELPQIEPLLNKVVDCVSSYHVMIFESKELIQCIYGVLLDAGFEVASQHYKSYYESKKSWISGHTGIRERLPTVRRSLTQRREVCGFKTYVTVSFYDDGRPGEVFIKLAKHGTELSGTLDIAAVVISMALQYGVPWPVIEQKLRGTRFGKDDGQHTSLGDGLAQIVKDLINQWNS